MEHDVPTGRMTTRSSVLEDPYALAALSGASLLLLAWSYPLWGGFFNVVCPLRAITGIPCPTCYGTRAMLALVAGEWGTALRLNPLVAAGGMGLAAFVPAAALTVVSGLPRPRVSATFATRVAWLAVAATLFNWVYLVVAHGVA